MGEDAAAIRKLWSLSKEIAKGEIADLTGPEKSKTKVDLSLALALEREGTMVGCRGHPWTEASRAFRSFLRALALGVLDQHGG